MDQAVIDQLNDLNRAFYDASADDFESTRRGIWAGWDRLIPYLPAVLSALDVGCGTGRFGAFLAQRLTTVRYHGMDYSARLLDHARALLTAHGVDFTLETRDIVTEPPDQGAYDLVVAFGLLHHVPGRARRESLVRALADRVAAGGVLVWSEWRFYEYERFRERIIGWDTLDPQIGAQVEAGDYLLDWRQGDLGRRYCHYIDDVEHAALIAASGLTLIESFRADSHTRAANCYAVLRRPPA